MRFSWPFSRPGLGLAISERTVIGVREAGGRDFVRRDLPEGLVEPAVSTPNIRSVSDLARIVQEVLGELDTREGELALVLPDLAVTAVLLQGQSGESDQRLWAELASSLPFPSSEARHDFWRGRGGGVLAAAVRESVVAQYERAVAATGRRSGWVDAASLVKLPGFAPAASGQGLAVLAQLYRSHYSLAVFGDGVLVDLRTKLRAPGSLEALRRELLRIPRLHESRGLRSLTLLGEDAAALASSLEGAPEIGALTVEADGEETLLASCALELTRRAA